MLAITRQENILKTSILQNEFPTEIKEAEIHIWIIPLKLSCIIYERLESSLSKKELIKADNFKFKKDKLQYVGAHGFLRIILGQYLRIPPQAVEYEFGQYGKPFLKNQPSLYNLYFNMSHSYKVASYAITRENDVGIDIEFINKNNTIEYESLSEVILSKKEYMAFKKIEKSKKLKTFLQIWTFKEALLKAIGQGLNYPLDKVEISIFPNKLPEVLSINGRKGKASSWFLHTLLCPKGYVGSLALNCEKRKLKHIAYHYPLISLET